MKLSKYSKVLCVSNLPGSVDEQILKELFSQVAPVNAVYYNWKKYTAWIDYKSEHGVLSAMLFLSNIQLFGQKCLISRLAFACDDLIEIHSRYLQLLKEDIKSSPEDVCCMPTLEGYDIEMHERGFLNPPIRLEMPINVIPDVNWYDCYYNKSPSVCYSERTASPNDHYAGTVSLNDKPAGGLHIQSPSFKPLEDPAQFRNNAAHHGNQMQNPYDGAGYDNRYYTNCRDVRNDTSVYKHSNKNRYRMASSNIRGRNMHFADKNSNSFNKYHTSSYPMSSSTNVNFKKYHSHDDRSVSRRYNKNGHNGMTSNNNHNRNMHFANRNVNFFNEDCSLTYPMSRWTNVNSNKQYSYLN